VWLTSLLWAHLRNRHQPDNQIIFRPRLYQNFSSFIHPTKVSESERDIFIDQPSNQRSVSFHNLKNAKSKWCEFSFSYLFFLFVVEWFITFFLLSSLVVHFFGVNFLLFAIVTDECVLMRLTKFNLLRFLRNSSFVDFHFLKFRDQIDEWYILQRLRLYKCLIHDSIMVIFICLIMLRWLLSLEYFVGCAVLYINCRKVDCFAQSKMSISFI